MEFSFLNGNLMVPAGLFAYLHGAAGCCAPQKVQINVTQEHHALVFVIQEIDHD
jgi:hypothetical protein